MYNPSYLILSRHNIFYFRYPLEFAFGVKQRVSVSLKTRCPKEALRLARALEYHAFIMTNDPHLQSLDYLTIKEILKNHFTEVLELMKCSIDADGAMSEDKVKRLNDLRSYALEAIKDGRDELYGGLFTSDDDIPSELSLDRTLEPIVTCHDLPTDKASKEYKALRKEYKYALDGYIGALLSYNDSEGYYDIGRQQPKITTHVNQSELKLKNVIGVFKKEIKPHKGAKGFRDHTGCLNYLMEILGEECLITHVDYPKARKVKDMLLKTPSNRNKIPLTRDLSLEEQIELQKVHNLDVLSASSVNKNLGYISTLFAWAKKNKYISENPFEGMKVKVNKKASRRENFEKEEVLRILGAIEGLDTKAARNKAKYWGAIVAVYTGARLNEIAALTPDDIKYDEESKIWYFDITDDDDSKSIKTDAAERFVPIHSTLLELGFLEYVEHAREVIAKMPEKGGYKTRLLYDLTFTQDGKWGRKIGRWFNEKLLKELGLKTEKKTFHSLRHSFITYLSVAGVDNATIKSIVGHEADTVTTQTYTHYGMGHLPTFKKAIEKLPY